jgi:DNA repair exonuclease SbcCD nuclease subunit
MVKKIFHTADWQYIKNKERPLQHVLNEYLKDVQKHTADLDYEEALQVIAGDILENIHDLVKIDEFLGVMKMFKRMSEITPLIFTGGNHDNKKDNAIDDNDNLLKIMNNWDWYKVFYLKESQVFDYENIRFFNYSIYNQSKPPKDYNKHIVKDKFNIGLYHDPLNCAGDYGGKEFKTSPSLEIFSGLDAVMMGDIHKRQAFEFEKGAYAVYAGSPYQRRVSESINEHGYVLWTLDEQINFEFVDLDNPYTVVKGEYDFDNKSFKIKNKA